MSARSHLILIAVIMALISCNHSGVANDIHIAIENQSSEDLDNIIVHFGPNQCLGGFVASGSGSTTLFYRYPITPIAKVTWTTKRGGAKETNVNLSNIVPPEEDGTLTITFHKKNISASFSTN